MTMKRVFVLERSGSRGGRQLRPRWQPRRPRHAPPTCSNWRPIVGSSTPEQRAAMPGGSSAKSTAVRVSTRVVRLILFGSNTHGGDWENSPRMFDPASLAWSRVYPFDPPPTYAVTRRASGGRREGRSFVGHAHLRGRAFRSLATRWSCVLPGHGAGSILQRAEELWPKVRKFPTWTFDLKTSRWRALECEPVHFFPDRGL